VRLALALLALALLTGCNVKPFGFAPWVIVLPGGRLNVVIGNKSEDHRTIGKQPVDGDKPTGFSPPEM